MDTFSVFQEMSMLLYAIAGLMIVLIVVAIGVWMRLGALVETAPKPLGRELNPYRQPERPDGLKRY